MDVPVFTLNNGTPIPAIGYGCFKVDPAETQRAVRDALEVGYRHIDTASFYRNEGGVGGAIREFAIDRSDVFITTKAWMNEHGASLTRAAFDRSLNELGTDYIDLYLLHWPSPAAIEAWGVLEELLAAGRARAIGVSNYSPEFLAPLLEAATVVPSVNQIELHPRLQLAEWVTYCQARGIRVEAWAPLMKGRVVEIAELQEIAAAHGRTAAQVALRWHHQRGVVVIPKSTRQERMRENFEIFDFELSDFEMARIAALDSDGRVGPTPRYMYDNGAPPPAR